MEREIQFTLPIIIIVNVIFRSLIDKIHYIDVCTSLVEYLILCANLGSSIFNKLKLFNA